MTIIATWKAWAFPAREMEYRLGRDDEGRYRLDVKLAHLPDSAYALAVAGQGHSLALRVGEMIREEKEDRGKVLNLKRRSA